MIRVHILFGDEAVKEFERTEDGTEDWHEAVERAESIAEWSGSYSTFDFATEDEVSAFILGLDAGQGWGNYLELVREETK